jgi:hypothetical protein
MTREEFFARVPPFVDGEYRLSKENDEAMLLMMDENKLCASCGEPSEDQFCSQLCERAFWEVEAMNK